MDSLTQCFNFVFSSVSCGNILTSVADEMEAYSFILLCTIYRMNSCWRRVIDYKHIGLFHLFNLNLFDIVMCDGNRKEFISFSSRNVRLVSIATCYRVATSELLWRDEIIRCRVYTMKSWLWNIKWLNGIQPINNFTCTVFSDRRSFPTHSRDSYDNHFFSRSSYTPRDVVAGSVVKISSHNSSLLLIN